MLQDFPIDVHAINSTAKPEGYKPMMVM